MITSLSWMHDKTEVLMDIYTGVIQLKMIISIYWLLGSWPLYWYLARFGGLSPSTWAISSYVEIKPWILDSRHNLHLIGVGLPGSDTERFVLAEKVQFWRWRPVRVQTWFTHPIRFRAILSPTNHRPSWLQWTNTVYLLLTCTHTPSYFELYFLTSLPHSCMVISHHHSFCII